MEADEVNIARLNPDDCEEDFGDARKLGIFVAELVKGDSAADELLQRLFLLISELDGDFGLHYGSLKNCRDSLLTGLCR